LLPQTAIRR